MTRFHLLALCWAFLPRAAGMSMKGPPAAPFVVDPAAEPPPALEVMAAPAAAPVAAPVAAVAAAPVAAVHPMPPVFEQNHVAPGTPPAAPAGDNAMANTYGFLRTASNKVGNTVEGVLGVEGSLTDMKKDLDTEYERWIVKKKALLAERDKLNSKVSRLNGVLLQQKDMKSETARINGNIAAKKAENAKQVAENKEAEEKRALDKKGMEEDIDALKCATKTIQQAKQDGLDAANKKTSVLKDQNRILQNDVFEKNKELNKLTVTAENQNIANKAAASTLLAKVEKLQEHIHGLEKELVAQAQLEETVQRARERLSLQSNEVVTQREKLTKASGQCLENKQQLSKDIEVIKAKLNGANEEMVKCQEMDGDNQHLQAELNDCINRKRSR